MTLKTKFAINRTIYDCCCSVKNTENLYVSTLGAIKILSMW